MTAQRATIAVVGGGYMGGGIAQTFAAHGFVTALVDADEPTSSARVAQLKAEAVTFAERGLIPEASAEQVRTHLRAAASIADAVSSAEYVTEAVPETPDLKHRVLARIDDAAPDDAVIATNTSALPIAELAAALARPERFLGVHWMNPAPFVPCVEIIPSTSTTADTATTATELIRAVGKAPTVVSDSPGFVANRLQYALLLEALRIVEEGVAGPAQVDEVVQNSFGFRLPFLGPIVSADMAGLDVYVSVFATMQRAFGERFAAPEILLATVAGGGLGWKAGRGFYEFGDGQGRQAAEYRDAAFAALGRLRTGLAPIQLAPTYPAQSNLAPIHQAESTDAAGCTNA